MKQNSLIVYYSWVGNTEVVAKEILRLTGADMQKIEERKDRKLGNIAGGAMSAFLGFKSNIKPMDFSLASYENIFLGLQVWAGRSTPAINRYLSKACFKDKKVWLFITKGDEKEPQKFIDSITKRIEKKGGKVIDTISITTNWEPKTNIPISPEEVEGNIQEWISSIKERYTL
jgi:flavodoxin